MPITRRFHMFDFAAMTTFLSFSILTLSIVLPFGSLDDSIVPAFVKHNPRGLATNQSLHDDQARWDGRITCKGGPGIPLVDIDCLRALQFMLVTDKNEPQDFGTEGSYRGARIWISGSCKIALDLDHVRIWRTFLMAFARAAALVQNECDKPGFHYYGGDLTYADVTGWEYLTISITGIPDRSVARDLNNLTAGLLSPPLVQNHLLTPPSEEDLTCDQGPGRPLHEFDCLRVVSNILLERDSATEQKFGTEGTYTGPQAWTWGGCTVSVDWTHMRHFRTTLLIFAKMAARIQHKCIPPGTWSYGGEYKKRYPSIEAWFVVKMTSKVDSSTASLN